MHLINLIVNYLYRKYGVALNNFFENWKRGISHLKMFKITVCASELYIIPIVENYIGLLLI